MTRRIQITLLSLLMSVCAMASETSVKNSDGVDIWYIFNSSTKTASVTYRGNYNTSYSNEYTGNVVIPSTVTYEGEKYSVTSIGDYAFCGCDALTSITLPEGVTSIGKYAFNSRYSLTSITLPEGVTSIGDDAFYCCYKLYEVYNKSNLTITAGSTDKGYVAYYAKNVYTDSEGESKLKTVGDYIFYVDGEDIELIAYTGSETSITLPSDYEGKNYNIGDYAFYFCSSLTSITLPEGLTSIGYEAFHYCYKLYEVYNKSDLTITAGDSDNGYVAYYAKNVYTDSEGESKLKTVGDYIFYVDGEDIELIAYTGGETSITLPSDYEGKNYNIGDYAFYECTALTSITLPEGVTSIGNSAFSRCNSLTSITLPESLTSIGEAAFVDCSSLRSITLPEGVTSIGDYAFWNCYALRSITLPEGLTSIGDYAFRNCKALTSITIPEGVTSIGNFAFYECYALTSVTLPEGVTSIGENAFYYCRSLTSITLPEGLTSIGNYAFQYCLALRSITIPEGVTSIGKGAFGNCRALTSVAIPSSMPSFGFWVFEGCDLNILTKLYYGGTIVDWCSYEFELWHINPLCYVRHLYIDGDEVKDLIIPKEVTSIGKFLFRSCHGLISVMIDDSVTEIGYGAFYECYGLKSVTIGKGVTSIGERAFYSCSALTSITSKNATPPTIGDSYTFYKVDKSIPVYVPKSSVDAYKSAEYWKDFTNIVGVYFVDVTAENGTVVGAGAYEENDEAILTATPAEGYKFVQWSDGVTDNPRTIVVVSDMTFTAEFELKEYTLTAEAENGTVEGAGTYKHGDEATLTATPAEGYKFVQWSDGVTDNPRTVVVVSDMTFTAEFELKEYTLTTEAENGTVEGAGTYKHGDEATLTATPAEGYKFVQWSDGVTDNPRTVVVVSDMTFTADVQKCWTVYATAENGNISGVGVYFEGDEATLTVTPNEGYKFVQWSDGVTDNPRTVVVVSDMTFTAEFELKEYTLTTEAENGTVKGAGTYKHGAEATLTATPAEGYKFVKWSDGVTDNSRTIVVVSDMTFTAEFELKEYTLTTEAENGTVEGAGTYKHGAEATLTVTPAEGYKFVQWSDGVTDNPRTIEVTSDLTLTAEFEIDVTPISDIQTSDVKVRLIGNEIAVEGTDDYTVYSISGQNLGKAESVERGIYIVVANGKCYKVIAK